MIDAMLQQAQDYRAEHKRLAETVEHAQRFAEALAADVDPGRRGVAAELIEIVGEAQ